MPPDSNLIRTFAARLRAHLSGSAGGALRLEAFDAPEEGVEFHPVSPVASPERLRDFAALTEEWVRRRCAPITFAEAHLIAENGRAVPHEHSAVHIVGAVDGTDGIFHAVNLTLIDGHLHAECDCGRIRHGSPDTGEDPLLCRHAAALLLICLPDGTARLPDLPEFICPITRYKLASGTLIYQCRRCRTAFSREGWEFLRDMDRGRCCNCGAAGAIGPFLPR